MPLFTRRKIVQFCPALIGLSISSSIGSIAKAAPRTTPQCIEDGPLTPRQAEGPYFKPASPQRMSLLEKNVEGERLIVEGTVYNGYCKPILGALIDFWQADGNGLYDNQSFKLRGHQYVDGEGRFHLETVVPGYYLGRTRHIHIKVQAPGAPILTTQLYFSGDPGNKRDPLHNKALNMKISERRGRKVAWGDIFLGVY